MKFYLIKRLLLKSFLLKLTIIGLTTRPISYFFLQFSLL
jgi:hypothetical protein